MCPYFLTIAFISAYIMLVPITSQGIDDAWSAVGALSMGIALGTRQSSAGQECLREHGRR